MSAPKNPDDLPPLTPTEDRREVARRVSGKDSKWPRTDRRAERVRNVLARRQPDLTIVLEHVTDLHNISAVMRTCDAVGVMRVHLVNPENETARLAFARTISAGSAKWMEWTVHESIDTCYRILRNEGFTILATALRPGGTDLFAARFHRIDSIGLGKRNGWADRECDRASRREQCRFRWSGWSGA